MAVDTREKLIEFIQARTPSTVYGALGIEMVSYDPDEVTLKLTVDDRHRQHAGLLHGGISVLLAESAASVAAALSVDMTEVSVAGMEINANHLRRVTSGVVTAVARPIHRGRKSHVYGVEVRDDQDRLVCVSRCTIAVTPLRGGMLGLG
jgi:uncharacterized protein (TIGR00369 family)